MSKGIHIGEKIQERVSEMHLSVAEFARKINKSRTSVYHLYRSRSVDSELLSKISDVLEVDFFSVMKRQKREVLQENHQCLTEQKVEILKKK